MIKFLLISDDSFFINSLVSLTNKEVKLDVIDFSKNQTHTFSYQKADLPHLILVKLDDPAPYLQTELDPFLEKSKQNSQIYFISSANPHFKTMINGNIYQNDPQPAQIKSFHKHSPVDKQSDKSARFNLSRRELDVIRLLSLGNSYKETAHKLDVSIETVRSHVKNTYSKMKVNNKTQAILKLSGTIDN